MNGFAERLERAMGERDITPGELARRVGVVKGAVSGWLSNKRPSRKNMQQLAEVLGVSAAWLEHGEGEGPKGGSDTADERASLFWWLRKQSPDGQRVLGEAASSSFDPKLDTIAREAAQNIRDARRRGEPTVTANFVLERLRGDVLVTFLAAMHFDELRPHLEAVAHGKGKQARVVRQALERLDQKSELIILRIEDVDGVGLIGDEYGESNYSALVRNVMDTIKDAGAGGSHGLGKSTIQRASAFGLLLFCSNLSEPEPGVEDRDGRLVGRVSLPWHEIVEEDMEYVGPGWFGVKDDSTPKRDGTARSTYASPALQHELRLLRPEQTGTSVLVVGAHDPSGQTENLVEMAKAISSSVAQNFFAALARHGDSPPIMDANVRVVDVLTDGSERVLHQEQVDPSVEMGPLVDVLDKADRMEVVEEMQQAGDVVRRTVRLRVPRRLEDPTHAEVTHDAVLLVRHAADDEAGHRFINSVVTMRGAFMRVSTLKPRGLGVGVRPFFAVLLAGDAAGTEPNDRLAEQFLLTAEPPSHMTWKVTTDVGTYYQARGAKKMLDDFERAMLTELRDVVTVSMREPSDGPQALRELLRIKIPPEPTSRPRVVKPVEGSPRADGAWELTVVTVQMPPKSNGWSFIPVLRFAAETGPGTTVKWDVEPVSGCTKLDDGRLHVGRGVQTATWRGVSNVTSHPVAAANAVVAVDIQRVVEDKESS